MSFTAISADFGLSIVTGEFFVQLNRQFEVHWCSRAEHLSQIFLFRTAYEAPSREKGFCTKKVHNQRKFRGRNFRVTDFENVRKRFSQRKSKKRNS